VVAGLTKDYDHFDMIKWGGYLSALSPFFPALSTSIWASCLMNILLSLGEAIWSPRLYQYTMNIAPEGKEASFSALASAPLFAGESIGSSVSSKLLSLLLFVGLCYVCFVLFSVIIGLIDLILTYLYYVCMHEQSCCDLFATLTNYYEYELFAMYVMLCYVIVLFAMLSFSQNPGGVDVWLLVERVHR
jgi:hypothetical protein